MPARRRPPPPTPPPLQRRFLDSKSKGVDVATDPRAPRLAHIVEPEEIFAKTGLTFLHTSHCLGTGEIVVSAMGDGEGNAKGGFVVLDEDFKVRAVLCCEL